MEFKINDKKKKDIFVSIFLLLKHSSSQINLMINPDTFHIQGMDKSHVCLFDLTLNAEWFSYYKVNEKYNICFDTANFHAIISIKSDDQYLVFRIEDGQTDVMTIEVLSDPDNYSKKSDYNKYFSLPLIEYEYEELSIPSTEYDAEIAISSKSLTDMLSQLMNFGQDIIIHCTEKCVDFETKGDKANMRVNVLTEDLNSYGIVEGEEIKLTYNLSYISKLCITNKLSADIELFLSNERPMKIKYDLGENSVLSIYIAPKMTEE